MKKKTARHSARPRSAAGASQGLPQQLATLQKLSASLDSRAPLAEREREQVADLAAEVIVVARAQGDRSAVRGAIDALLPHVAAGWASIESEEDWWKKWWAKTKWLEREYVECRRRYNSEARRLACFARKSAEAAMCAGSQGASGTATAMSVWIPLDALQRAGVDATGAEHVFGMVGFARAEGAIDLIELKDVDARAWGDIRRARLAARANIRRQVEATNKIDERARSLLQGFAGFTVAELEREALREVENEWVERAGRATSAMRKIGVVRHDGASYLVSFFNAQPEILAEVPPAGGVVSQTERDTLDEILFWSEFALEALVGLLGLLGVHFPAGRTKLSHWARRLMRRLTENRTARAELLKWIRSLGSRPMGAGQLLELLCLWWQTGVVDKRFLQDFLEDIADFGHWTILRIMLKLAGRATPGVGVALLLADLAMIVGEMLIKLDRRGSIDVLPDLSGA